MRSREGWWRLTDDVLATLLGSGISAQRLRAVAASVHRLGDRRETQSYTGLEIVSLSELCPNARVHCKFRQTRCECHSARFEWDASDLVRRCKVDTDCPRVMCEVLQFIIPFNEHMLRNPEFCILLTALRIEYSITPGSGKCRLNPSTLEKLLYKKSQGSGQAQILDSLGISHHAVFLAI